MREGVVKRDTRETKIDVKLVLDGKGNVTSDTGVAFFDHMITGMARHGLFDLELVCKGDLEVDDHHTIEDCGIALGTAIAKAVGDKKGICRFGQFILPMDDALVLCAVDLSGRPYLGYDLVFSGEKMGQMDTAMVREFFYAVSYSAGMNIHLKMLSGENDHHVAEAAFKAFGKALAQAVSKEKRLDGEVWSTKGTLA